MLSLWGRKADPVPGGEKSHYYSANVGQILSADGAGHVIPDLGKIEAEKIEYIPREFATQKVQSMVKDASSIQDAYKDHLDKVTAFYQNALEQSKVHYEGIVQDLKKKAQRHVEVNKQMRQDVEDRLNKELRQSEETVDELRDDMARLNREYQDETRKIKARLQAAEAEAQRQKIVIDDYECTSSAQMALQDIKHEVERRALHDEHNEITRSLLDQIQSIQQEFGQSFASEQQQHVAALQLLKDDYATRKICSSAMGDILLRLEIQDMRSHLAHVATLQAQLTDTVSRLEESEKRVQELNDELQAAKLAHSDLSAQSSAYVEEIERISRQFEEEKQALLADYNLRILSAVEQGNRAEVLAVLNDLTCCILQSSLQEAETEALTHGSQLQGTKAQLDALQAKHHAKLKTVQGEMQQQLLSLGSKHDQRLQDLQSRGDRLEVGAVLERLVGHVAERTLVERATLAEQSLQNVHSHTGSSSDQLVEEIGHLKAQLQQAQAALQQQQQQQQHQQQAALPGTDRGAEGSGGAVSDAGLRTAPGGGDQSAASAPPSSEADSPERQRLVAEIEATRTSLTSTHTRLQDALSKLAPAQAERERTKVEIKEWTRDFVAQNGRDPEVADKALIKDKYQRYKASSSQSKELEGLSAQLQAETTALDERLRSLEGQLAALPAAPRTDASAPPLAAPTAAPLSAVDEGAPKPVVDMRDAEIQVAAHELRAAAGLAPVAGSQLDLSKLLPGGGSGGGGGEGGHVAAVVSQLQQAHEEQVERLEDQLFDIKTRVQQLESEKQVLQSDHAFVSQKLEMLIKEKRTDVLKRFEEELERLRAAERELNEKVTVLQGERGRLEARVKEITSRAELAEQELKERDARELSALNPTEEKSQLKTTINKQRDQIVLKSKAATAGWDAAAKADEKLELEVQRAYTKGMKDEREQHKKDMDGLHQALEAKESRITELLTQITGMELTVRQSTTDQSLMRSQMEALRLEVADAVAAIQSVGGGGGGGGGAMGEEDAGLPPSQAELESTREQLDAAQEELVHITERCDRLETELELARRKNRYYERLSALTGLHTGTVVMPTNGKNELAVYDLNAVVNNVKKVIVKCTNLWKSNRKDECYDLYLEVCHEAQGRLLTEDLAKPLRDSTEHGRNQGAMNKQRGAVVLRKALDKLLADAGQPALKAAEDAAVAALRSQQSATAQQENENKEAMVQDLVRQLQSLENSLLDQGFTSDRNPTNSSSTGDETRSPRGDPNASSLLLRAKAAESQVASLKKQMAAIISATAQAASGAAPAEGRAALAAEAAQATDSPAGSALPAGGMPGRVPTTAGTGGGADPAEVRRLNRKIKDLEAQLKNANSGGGSGGGPGAAGSGADAKALQAAEKALQKKLKDQEAAQKRETKGLEMRATKAENALQKIQSTYNSIVSERDQFKAENAKLFGLNAEVGSLRAKAERCDALDGELAAKDRELAMLQDQFKKESALRKKYKNELEDLKGAIRVFARCRPMARYELEKGCKAVVEIKDETSMRLTTSRGEKDFEFDAVFSPTSTQDQVFEDTKRLVESCLDGFNVCLFAYGQTGSGKTFTMTGSSEHPGLTPKAINELFRLMAERVHLQIKVTTYFVELYNDNLVDLYWLLENKATLAKSGNAEPPKLEIKMDNKKMVYIRNAVIKEAASPEELMELFNKGNVERHTGATKMNAESSRSHSIFAIMVESYDTTSRRTTNGKLSLVDLAGSERADKTGASAERLKEAQSINKSLSALGDVIAALSEGGGAGKHIPYRNNKLTQVMQDSLGGNAKTLMFVNFSPADYNADETSTSLMYASRVKKIVNNASKQAESEEVARLKAIIKRLQGGQGIADLVEPEPPAEDPVIEDDGKVYDGY